uniref:ENTH domain-containing protein n=1 Tax=Nelumbo nucifera TaxID=4432 RepID=A0A822ZBP1_NELNU|nr:TPA_asm: hypothetical protein HUJ06_014779 [Nelumbo nucifera]
MASLGKAMIISHVGFSGIEISVVRATGHDNTAIDDKHLHEILFFVSNSPGSVPFLVERISYRLDKTRDRNVAPMTLLLIHRLLRGGDRYFEQDLRTTHLSVHLQMNITRWFPRNSSNQSLSFLHSYADFLAKRMGWMINQAGKMEPIMFQASEFRFYEEKSIEMVFHRLPKCQSGFDHMEEVGYNREVGFVWLKQRKGTRQKLYLHREKHDLEDGEGDMDQRKKPSAMEATVLFHWPKPTTISFRLL